MLLLAAVLGGASACGDGKPTPFDLVCADVEDATGCAPGLRWISIPGGGFEMGCSVGDELCWSDEYPRHQVFVSDFSILETEVTEGQYFGVMGGRPSCESRDDYAPVECVTWYDAVSFCEAVGGRLPTEAEWEYAARGGSPSRFGCGNEYDCLVELAWFGAKHKQLVKGMEPNALGVYDMLGNVEEWTADVYDLYGSPRNTEGTSRTVRGGSFLAKEDPPRVSARYGAGEGNIVYTLGFRCVR